MCHNCDGCGPSPMRPSKFPQVDSASVGSSCSNRPSRPRRRRWCALIRCSMAPPASESHTPDQITYGLHESASSSSLVGAWHRNATSPGLCVRQRSSPAFGSTPRARNLGFGRSAPDHRGSIRVRARRTARRDRRLRRNPLRLAWGSTEPSGSSHSASYGPLLLGVVAAGLIGFALSSIAEVRFRHV
jgi:hypothetical protein